MALATIQTDIPNELGLYYNWDFTQSLSDTVNGKEAVLVNSAARTENGVTILADKDKITLGNLNKPNIVIEVDIAENPCTQNTENSCIFSFNDSHGITYKASSGTDKWGVYDGSWLMTENSDRGYFQHCTLSLRIDNNSFLSIYRNNTLVVDCGKAFNLTECAIGIDKDTIYDMSAIGMTVTGVRVYSTDPDIPAIDGHAESYTFFAAHMKALADAIREKTGKSGALNILNMIEEIKNL